MKSRTESFSTILRISHLQTNTVPAFDYFRKKRGAREVGRETKYVFSRPASLRPRHFSIMENQEKGKWGEEAAVRYLRGKGFEIRDVNWKFLHLEIDIVAMHENELVIVEVKTRGTDAFGEPEVFVNKTKQARLIRAANLYLEQKKLDHEVRFDVVGIVKRDNESILRHIPGAFQAYGG
jgi:putative endonuclease